MNDLPRSRALVRLDGPGHIMPVEPVTPPDSRVLRVVHLPLILAALSIALLFGAATALNMLGVGLEAMVRLPGARLVAPLIGTALIAILYYGYVRLVERRPHLQELGLDGWWQELGVGFAGGLLLSLVVFAVLIAAGAAHVISVNPARVMIFSIVVQSCTAFLAEIILCGLGFRLIERLLGSWITLLLGMIVIGIAGYVVSPDPSVAIRSGVAAAIEGALLFAAPYMLTRRLWAATGLNAARRIAQIALYGLSMSEIGPRGLLVTYVSGPDWLTGGLAGLSASPLVIISNALAAAGILYLAVRRGRIVRPAWRRGRFASALD